MRQYHLYEENGVSRDARDKKREGFFWESLASFMETDGRPDRHSTAKELFMDGKPSFLYGPAGKPYFAHPRLKDIFFSVSDTAGFRVVVFAYEEVGIDAENIAARNLSEDRMRRLADRCFTEAERDWLWGETQRDTQRAHGGSFVSQAERFFWLWTRKEAYVKFTGRGIAQGLNTFSVLDDAPARIETDWADGRRDIIVSVCRAYGGAADVARTTCGEM